MRTFIWSSKIQSVSVLVTGLCAVPVLARGPCQRILLCGRNRKQSGGFHCGIFPLQHRSFQTQSCTERPCGARMLYPARSSSVWLLLSGISKNRWVQQLQKQERKGLRWDTERIYRYIWSGKTAVRMLHSHSVHSKAIKTMKRWGLLSDINTNKLYYCLGFHNNQNKT